MAAAAKEKALSPQEIGEKFNEMRQTQQALAQKINELQMEINEFTLVEGTLKGVDSSRKCYRNVGGVLVERTVKEVLPAITQQRDQMAQLVTSLETKFKADGKQLVEFQTKYGIRLKGEGPAGGPSSTAAPSPGVLVSH